MDELAILDDLGRALDPPTGEPPARLRHRLLARMRPAPRRRSPGWRLAGAGGLAAAVAIGLIATQSAGKPHDGTPPAMVPAAQILHDAATAARNSPDISPRPDQFIFIETNSQRGSAQPADPTPTGTAGPGPVAGRAAGAVEPPSVRQTWLSADGTADGLVRSRPRSSVDRPESYRSTPIDGCRNGLMVQRDKNDKVVPGSSRPCTPQPGYLQALPTDPDAMLRYLQTHSQGQNGRDIQAFITAGDLLDTSYEPPAALAALFEAVAEIPGVTVAQNVTDAAGRKGVAVAMTHNGVRDYLVFDATTHAYLGTRSTPADSDDLIDATALLRVAAVDRAGQLP
jgi:hypothetical protein